MNSKNDTRYPASSSMMPQRPYGLERRRSLSPDPLPPVAYSAYDRYTPTRGSNVYRDPFGSSYRPEPWHADRPYSGSPPSPDPYRPSRPLGDEGWGRPTSWRPQDEPAWPERRPAPEVYDTMWQRPRRDTMAQPMFEPSDNWKQSHSGPHGPHGDAPYWPYDRYSGESIRDIRDRSPERPPVREPLPPVYAPPERPRRISDTSDSRDSHLYTSRLDSYRPTYEDRGPLSSLEVRHRSQKPTRDRRYVPRPELSADRTWYPREKSASGGSVQTSPLPSPIRTRTNLPDRVPFGHSRSNSGSYPQSPAAKAASRPTWDIEQAPQTRYPSPKPDSYSIQRAFTYTAPRGSEIRHEGSNGAWGSEQLMRSPTPTLSSKPDARPSSPSSSPKDREQIPSMAPSRPLSRVEAVSIEREVAYPIDTSQSSTSIVTEGEALGAHVAFLSTPNRHDHRLEENEQPLQAQAIASGQQPPLPQAWQLLAESSAMDDVGRGKSSQYNLSAMRTPSRDSSPEPDIPLATLAKHVSTRASASGPSTPLPEESEPPSRDEYVPPPRKWLAPNIQPASEPMPLHEVLRAVVMVRLQRDHQTQEERVTPVLLDNLSKSGPPSMPSVTTPEDIIREVTADLRKQTIQESHVDTRASLRVRFAQRQADLTVQVAKLREEYMGLHRQWLVHCGKLDDVAKAIALQEAAATAGRTTRRSMATMGDAVRSDLEMEQIIASLGNEEMTDANHLGAKNAAVIPDMITVTRGEVDYLYDDTNNGVESPLEYYSPQTGIHDWTEEEVTIFLDKFGEFPKQFGIIADFLPNKTPSQCVTFYYLHKNKHIDFRQVVARRATKRKRGGRKQKSNALLADIRKRDDEVSAAGPSRRRRAPASTAPTVDARKGSRRATAVAQAEQTPNGTPTPEPDNEPRKRRRRVTTARADGTIEQDDGVEEMDVDVRPKRIRKPRRAAASTPSASTPLSVTPLATPALPGAFETDPMEESVLLTRFADHGGPSMQRKHLSNTWSEEDKAVFLHLLAQYGDDFKRIAASMPNRTTAQVGAFYKTHADQMDLHAIAARAPKRSPTPELRQGVWKHASFTGPGVSFQKTRPPAEHYYQAPNGSGSSTPTANMVASGIGAFPYHPSPYETVQMPYGYHRPPAMVDEDLSQVGMSTMHTHHMEHIANPSPFATGPLTTRFSVLPYRNFSPSHFTDNSAPSFSAASIQSSYAQNAGAHEAAPYIAKMSNMSSSDYR